MKELEWRKALPSGGGDCVEVAITDDRNIAIRDSKNPEGGRLEISPASFKALLALAGAQR